MMKRLVVIPWYGEPRHRGFVARIFNFHPQNRMVLIRSDDFTPREGWQFYQTGRFSETDMDTILKRHVRRHFGIVAISRDFRELTRFIHDDGSGPCEIIVGDILLSSSEWVRQKQSAVIPLKKEKKLFTKWWQFQRLRELNEDGLLYHLSSVVFALPVVQAFLKGTEEPVLQTA